MILKASQRGGAKQLADHLLNGVDNEHVEVHEVRGFMSNDLAQALNETYAHARANDKIKKFLFSMSINPPKGKTATQADMVAAADEAEKQLGLEGQPRVIVFHEKEGRRHAHAVWSRVDDNIKAIKLDYFKNVLTDISRELYLKHGWELPKGLKNKQDRSRTNYSLSEHQAAKRKGLDAKEVKARIQACWDASNDVTSFQSALSNSGFALAKGDNNRSFVIIDADGGLQGLNRALPYNAKAIKTKLGKAADLQTIEDARASFKQQDQEQTKQALEELAHRHKTQRAPLQNQIDTLTTEHKTARQKLETFHQTRQIEEHQHRQAQYQKGLRGLWHFITGSYRKQKQRHETEYQAGVKRDAKEKETLIEKQLNERQVLQNKLDTLKERQQAERIELMGHDWQYTRDTLSSKISPSLHEEFEI